MAKIVILIVTLLVSAQTGVSATRVVGDEGPLKRGCKCSCKGHPLWEANDHIQKNSDCAALNGAECEDRGAKGFLQDCRIAIEAFPK